VALDERSRVGAHWALDVFHAQELGCSADLLREPGLHFMKTEHRARPSWGGYTVPLLAVSTPGGGVVSCRPDLAERVQRELRGLWCGALNAEVLEGLRKVGRQVVPYAYSLNGYALSLTPADFKPHDGLAERLVVSDTRGRDLRRRFDGEIFVVTGARGEIAAWSAIKLKSDDVWEIAVVTEAPYRGRGYAKQVVSAATRHILESGRVPLYVHDRANHASARVCRSLGYQEYAEVFFCEY
jgi:GNAT superfamily N-acetyltransferase